MFRFIILSIIIGFCSTASIVSRKSDRYHIRDAPQDPVIYINNGNYIHDDYNNYNVDYENNDENLNDDKNILNRNDIELEKAKTAKYSFNAAVQDTINDHSHIRNEERDGLKVHGMYSYSDGYYYRTVHYEADENGYRIVKENVKKIGDGPKFNPSGRADISGSLLNQPYSIIIDNDKSPHYTEYKNRRV